MAVTLDTIRTYLDSYLHVGEVPDSARALNGLQVDGEPSVSRIATAVDACQATIEGAANAGAQLLIVHHGLFWGGLEPLTGRHGRRVRLLIERGIALYSAHIPLDLHPEVGNNPVLARRLGVKQLEGFGDFEGVKVGVMGSLDISRDTLVQRVRDVLGVEPNVIATGPDKLTRVAIITGAGGGAIREARDAGAQALVTGEGAHHTYFDAEEWGVNVIYAGHYATETVGVQALGQHLADKFGVPWQFIDHPTGM